MEAAGGDGSGGKTEKETRKRGSIKGNGEGKNSQTGKADARDAAAKRA